MNTFNKGKLYFCVLIFYAWKKKTTPVNKIASWRFSDQLKFKTASSQHEIENLWTASNKIWQWKWFKFQFSETGHVHSNFYVRILDFPIKFSTPDLILKDNVRFHTDNRQHINVEYGGDTMTQHRLEHRRVGFIHTPKVLSGLRSWAALQAWTRGWSLSWHSLHHHCHGTHYWNITAVISWEVWTTRSPFRHSTQSCCHGTYWKWNVQQSSVNHKLSSFFRYSHQSLQWHTLQCTHVDFSHTGSSLFWHSPQCHCNATLVVTET